MNGQIFKWAYNKSKSCKWRIILVVIYGSMCISCGLLSVYFSKQSIDIATKDKDGNLVLSLIYTASSILLSYIFTNLKRWQSEMTAKDIETQIRSSIFKKLLRGKWSKSEKYHSGDILTRLSQDISDVTNIISVTVPETILLVVELVASFIFLANQSAMLAWVVVGIVPVFIALRRLYFKPMHEIVMKTKTIHSKLSSIIQESMLYRIILMTLERTDLQMDSLEREQDTLKDTIVQKTKLSIISRSAMWLGMSGGYMIAFCWGATGISKGIITFGTMTAFLQLTGRVQRPVIDMVRSIPTFISTWTAIERLMEIDNIEQEEDLKSIHLKEPISITFNDVCFSYDKNKNILNNFSKTFKAGTTSAILGETGSGKSTMAKLMLALENPDSGSIYMSDGTTSIPASAATRCNYIYVPQSNMLFSDTIRNNLTMGSDKECSDKDLAEVLHISAADFVLDLPNGLDTWIGENNNGLSVGQVQRISIARALLHNGGIMLLDEATSALDEETENIVFERIQKYAKNKTIIFITHHKRLSEVCDNIVHL